jgi:hypothetical protein
MGDFCKLEHSETMTAVECIAADGWQMDLLFLFMSATLQESWFHGCEALPRRTITGTPLYGWISDKLAIEWLQHLHEATIGKEPSKKREKCV